MKLNRAGALLRQAQATSGLSMNAISDRSGVSRSAITSLIGGEPSDMRLSNWLDVMESAGVDVLGLIETHLEVNQAPPIQAD